MNISFMQLVAALHIPFVNTYGSIVAYAVGLFFRITGGETLIGKLLLWTLLMSNHLSPFYQHLSFILSTFIIHSSKILSKFYHNILQVSLRPSSTLSSKTVNNISPSVPWPCSSPSQLCWGSPCLPTSSLIRAAWTPSTTTSKYWNAEGKTGNMR